jgi:hypothetical protein
MGQVSSFREASADAASLLAAGRYSAPRIIQTFGAHPAPSLPELRVYEIAFALAFQYTA